MITTFDEIEEEFAKAALDRAKNGTTPPELPSAPREKAGKKIIDNYPGTCRRCGGKIYESAFTVEHATTGTKECP